MQIITQSAQETQKLGEKLASDVIQREKGSGAFVVALHGELGSGKTTFVQGFARGLKISTRLLSPTYIIVRRYDLNNLPFLHLFHIDLYRIGKSDELENLGFDEILSDPQNIVLIEWAEKAPNISENTHVRILFDSLEENTRKLTLLLNSNKVKTRLRL